MFNYSGNKSESDYVHLHQSTLRYLTPNTGMVNNRYAFSISLIYLLKVLFCHVYSLY